jgi:hypothetical protein
VRKVEWHTVTAVGAVVFRPNGGILQINGRDWSGQFQWRVCLQVFRDIIEDHEGELAKAVVSGLRTALQVFNNQRAVLGLHALQQTLECVLESELLFAEWPGRGLEG